MRAYTWLGLRTLAGNSLIASVIRRFVITIAKFTRDRCFLCVIGLPRREDQIDSHDTLGAGVQALHGTLPLVQDGDMRGRSAEAGVAQGPLHQSPNLPAAVSEDDRHVPAGFEDAESFDEGST